MAAAEPAASDHPAPTEIDGKVLPAHIYHPSIVTSVWFKTWGLKCGRCGKDFTRFAFFGKPRCPYCGTRNAPQFTMICP